MYTTLTSSVFRVCVALELLISEGIDVFELLNLFLAVLSSVLLLDFLAEGPELYFRHGYILYKCIGQEWREKQVFFWLG